MENNIPELATCKRCALSKTRTRVVIGSGPDSPSLMVIGEAPGRHEDEGGEPFIGRSGQLLFRLIEEETGLLRSDCFVTNVVKCRPPNNRTPNKTELGACRPWLDSQFIAVAPQFVLALGNTASRTVFNHTEPIGAVHGKVISLGPVKGMATYHPAAALRQGPSVVDVMRQDLRILKTLLGKQ